LAEEAWDKEQAAPRAYLPMEIYNHKQKKRSNAIPLVPAYAYYDIFLENWVKEIPLTFVSLNKNFDNFSHFGYVLPFCNGKNSKISFKNKKKICKPLETLV